MVDHDDVYALKGVRTMLTRHGIDISRADVRVQKGICYIRGFISCQPNAHIADLDGEMDRVAHLIRTKPEIRGVVLEVTTTRR